MPGGPTRGSDLAARLKSAVRTVTSSGVWDGASRTQTWLAGVVVASVAEIIFATQATFVELGPAGAPLTAVPSVWAWTVTAAATLAVAAAVLGVAIDRQFSPGTYLAGRAAMLAAAASAAWPLWFLAAGRSTMGQAVPTSTATLIPVLGAVAAISGWKATRSAIDELPDLDDLDDPVW